ncbi:MAG: HAD-IC family P-type ATPase, partial [Christensenellales bacterium]
MRKEEIDEMAAVETEKIESRKTKLKKVKKIEKQKQQDANMNIQSAKQVVSSKLSKEDIKRIKKIKKSKTYNLLNAERFDVDIKKGLSSSQVNSRIEQGYVNYYEANNTKTYGSIFFSNIFTFFNLLCFLIAMALILVGSFNNLFFAVIFLSNITIGIIQEIKAKKTVEKISLVTSPTAKVIRDGKKQEIRTNEVVLDDVLVYEFGNQICTDSVIMKGEIEVNESLLTGESVSVKKKKGDLILAGSFVTSGSCFAKAERVAEENYTSKLTLKAKKYSKPKSELLTSLRMIIKVIGVLIIPLGVAIFLNNKAIIGNDLKLLVTKSAGSIIGMIPAGLFLLTSLALAVGVIKLAKKKTLVQDLYGIEMLSRASVLCLDKTGTITDGTMMVKQIKMLRKQDDLNQILSSMLSSMKTQNQTFNALKNYFGEEKVFESGKIFEFNSAKKFSGVSFTNGKTYFLG